MSYDDDVAAARAAVEAAQADLAAAAAAVTAAQKAVADADAEFDAARQGLAEAQAHLDDLLAHPPQPETTLIWGYSHANKARLEADTKALVRADRAYESGVPLNQDDTVAKGMAAGVVPIISMKVGTWASAIMGSQATAFERYLRSITRPTVVIVEHEPENDAQKDPAAFKAMTVRALDIAARVANPNVQMAINLMTSWINVPLRGSANYKGPRSEEYIPTGRTDFVLSWDGYTHDRTTTPEQKFGPALRLNQKYGLEFAICETANEVDPARWVTLVSDWCASIAAIWCCYWPSKTSTGPQYYPPASAFDEFRAVALKFGGKAI